MDMMDIVMYSFSSGELETNYWNTNWNKEGLVNGMIHQKTLHLLMPETQLRGGETTEGAIAEMRTGSKVIINPDDNGYLLTFDDGTETPYCIYLHKEQIAGTISKDDVGVKDAKVVVQTSDGTTIEWPAIVDDREVNVTW
ncbi:MAG: hypothetical protein IJS15_10055 [Victivallales bacterium]|nr:hypothetical protein [Victivallales bacterium]